MSLTYNAIKQIVQMDFNKFDFSDKPMEKYCAYNRAKHIELATQMVINAFPDDGRHHSIVKIRDMIHGLNHIFFNGVAAGQSFERFRGENNEG